MKYQLCVFLMCLLCVNVFGERPKLHRIVKKFDLSDQKGPDKIHGVVMAYSYTPKLDTKSYLQLGVAFVKKRKGKTSYSLTITDVNGKKKIKALFLVEGTGLLDGLMGNRSVPKPMVKFGKGVLIVRNYLLIYFWAQKDLFAKHWQKFIPKNKRYVIRMARGNFKVIIHAVSKNSKTESAFVRDAQKIFNDYLDPNKKVSAKDVEALMEKMRKYKENSTVIPEKLEPHFKSRKKDEVKETNSFAIPQNS